MWSCMYECLPGMFKSARLEADLNKVVYVFTAWAALFSLNKLGTALDMESSPRANLIQDQF